LQFIKQHPVLIFFLGLLVLVAALVTKTFIERQNSDDSSRWGNDTTIVITEPAVMGTIVDEVESIGTAKANESVSLTSRVTDTVSKVNFEDGMYAEAGQILVELTNSEETALLAEAQASVDESTRQFNRLQNLMSQNLASQTQLDVEQARMQTSEARLKAIIARLDDRLVRAPFNGVLGFRNVSQGTLLSPNTIITTLDDISIIKLDFSIPELYLSVLREGQEVVATSPAYPGTQFVGAVKTIESRVDPITRSITIRAHLANDERLLRPGMLLVVNLIRSRGSALLVPEEAIVPIQNEHFVYVPEEGEAKRVKVDIGRMRPGSIEILSGLTEGQQVITQGIIKLHPGSKIEVKKKDQEKVQERAPDGLTQPH
jgi:membrane fusion protein (multidrug efflux system)